jgi:hypothetical protein
MKFLNAFKLHRKSGVWGTRRSWPNRSGTGLWRGLDKLHTQTLMRSR